MAYLVCHFRTSFTAMVLLGVTNLSIGQHDAPKHQWVNKPLKNLPDGVTHHTFASVSMKGRVIGYSVYLPPGYKEDKERRYPVVYWLHGGRGHELSGVSAVVPVAEQAIRTRELEPMIIVFNNGGPAWHYDDLEHQQLGETALVQELIPLIDRNYRTIPSRKGRGIEGMSMGGRATTRFLYKYPELFSSGAALAAGYGNEQKAVDAGRHVDNNVFSLARQYAQSRKEPVALLIVIGTEDFNYESNLAFDEYLRSLDLSDQLLILEGVSHSNREYYAKMGPSTLEFHAKNFATSMAAD